MNRIPASRFAHFAVLTFVLLCSVLATQAQTNIFTYQGKLNDGSAAANGNYDLQFVLYDALAGGSQLGTKARSNVLVSNGVFSVTLDFDAGLFSGAERYLEISVRQTGSGNYTTLTPRQQITSTPYAIRSLNAGTAENAQQLNGTPGNQYVLTTDSRLSDDRNPKPGSAFYIQNTTSSQSGANFNITGNGTIGGNSTVGGSSTVGVNSEVKGSFGIPSINANARLFVASPQVAIEGISDGVRTANAIGSGVVGYNNVANTSIATPGGAGVFGQNFNETDQAVSVWGYARGKGIGVFGTSPTGTAVEGISTSGNGVVGYTEAANTSLAAPGGAGVYGVNFNRTDQAVSIWGYAYGKGRGVFGTSEGGNGLYGTTNAPSLNAKTTPYAGVYGKNENTTGSAVGVWGDAVGSGTGVYGHSPNGSGIYGSSDTGNGTIGYTFGTSLDNAGVYARSFGTSPAGYFINTDGGLAGRFSGNVRVEGVVTQTSDARLKERITGLRYGLREVMQLRPVSFWWKKQPDSPQQLGLIAQEVETVLPDLVAHSDDATTPLAVNYIGLIPVVIKAVQEQESVVQKQQSELEQKNAEIKAIKAENAALNARLAALEQMMQQLRKQPQQQQQ